MTVLSAQTIRSISPQIVWPFYYEKTIFNGMSFGLSHAGYDIRVKQRVVLNSINTFALASSVEEFHMPNDVLGIVHDKSSWARKGLSVFNTVLEPNWTGFLTLELALHKPFPELVIEAGSPIAQIVFHKLDFPTDTPYGGKYQNQPNHPVDAIAEVMDVVRPFLPWTPDPNVKYT